MNPKATPGPQLTDWYMTIDELVLYSRISRRQLERYLHRPINPLPHVRNGRRLLVLKSTFDDWITGERRPSSLAPPSGMHSADEIIALVQARHASRRAATPQS